MAGIDTALVEVSPGETRTALLSGAVLTELTIDRMVRWPAPGTVIRGRVARRHQGSKALFVDLGRGVTGFLPEKDVPGGKPPASGSAVLVQVTRAAHDEKGPRLTGKPVVPGLHASFRPLTEGVAISGRVKNRDDHIRLMALGGGVLAEGEGVLWRHTGAGVDEDRLVGELAVLKTMWGAAVRTAGDAPLTEINLPGGAIAWTVSRHLAGLREIAVEGAAEARALQDWITALGDDLRVEPVDPATPVFDRFDVAGQIEAALGPNIPLPSGGSIMIEQTAALTAIDVNAGRSGAKPLDTNREALRRIVREVRLRGLGGLIVIDFIDLPDRDSRRVLDNAVWSAFAADPVRTDILALSRLGLVELSRLRQGPALADLMSVRDAGPAAPMTEAAAMETLRAGARAAPSIKAPAMSLTVPAAVASWLAGQPALTEMLEIRAGKPVYIRPHADPMAQGVVAAPVDPS